MAKKSSKKSRKAGKKVQPLTPEAIIKQDEKPAPNPATLKGVGLGIFFAKLAGSPSRQAVTAIFGTSGYQLSWLQRAVKLGVTPESLCEDFKNDPASVKERWAVATAKKELPESK